MRFDKVCRTYCRQRITYWFRAVRNFADFSLVMPGVQGLRKDKKACILQLAQHGAAGYIFELVVGSFPVPLPAYFLGNAGSISRRVFLNQPPNPINIRTM